MKGVPVISMLAAIVVTVSACGGLNNRVDRKVEEVGTELTEVPVDVRKVKIKFFAISGQISDVTVGNPDGYVTVNAFDMERFRVNIGLLATLTGGTIVLDELVVDSPVLTFERNAAGGSNIQEIADNIKKNQESRKSSGPKAADDDEDDDGDSTRIAVKKLRIEGVTFRARRLDGSFRSGALPDIELSDVGGKEGTTPAGLGAVIIGAMAAEMLRQAVARRMMEGSRFQADRVLELLSDRLALTPDQIDEVTPAARAISDGLNNILLTWTEQGYVDFGALVEDFEPVAVEVKTLLADVLDTEQAKELEALFDHLDTEAAEALRTAIVERTTAEIGVDESQLRQLKPIVGEHLDQIADLIKDHAGRGERSPSAFNEDYEQLRQRFRSRIRTVLTVDQYDALVRREDGIRVKVQDALFGSG